MKLKLLNGLVIFGLIIVLSCIAGFVQSTLNEMKSPPHIISYSIPEPSAPPQMSKIPEPEFHSNIVSGVLPDGTRYITNTNPPVPGYVYQEHQPQRLDDDDYTCERMTDIIVKCHH